MERFSYWDDSLPAKVAWDHEHYYGEIEHEYQPHHFKRGEYVYWSENPGTQYEVTDFDPSDGQYKLDGQHWADPEDLSTDIEDFGEGHDEYQHQEHLQEEFPVGATFDYHGHIGVVDDHDPADPGNDVHMKFSPGQDWYGSDTMWVDSNDLKPAKAITPPPSKLDPDSPYAQLHTEHDPNAPSKNPRGFMPGDEVTYDHPNAGPLPGVIKDPVHPFNEGESVLNLDMHTDKGGHPPFPGYPPMDTSAPHDLIKQKYKHDRGDVNMDAGIPEGITHPAQTIPIGATVYFGHSGKPWKVNSFTPSDGTYYGKARYEIEDPADGEVQNRNATELKESFHLSEGQRYKYGDQVYYGALPGTVTDYNPSNSKYTVFTESGEKIIGAHGLSHQPSVPEGAKHQVGDTVYHGGEAHTIAGAVPYKYDPDRHMYQLMDGMGQMKHDVHVEHMLSDPDEKYPGQEFGKGDQFYHWNGDPLDYKSYNPAQQTYNLYNPKTDEEHQLGPGSFTDIPYTDMHTCKHCKGKGVIQKTCYTCHGSGVLPSEEENPQTDIFLTPQKGGGKCPTCEGKGVTESECSYCKGTGNNWKTPEMPPQLMNPEKIKQNENAGLTVACPKCHGYGDDPITGAICTNCGGKGFTPGPPKNSEPCPTCNGTDPNCPTCHGRGWHIPMPLDGHPCPGCNGTGQARSGNGKCQYCNGRGWQSDEGCPRCGGSGRDESTGGTCHECHGTGKRTLPLTTSYHTDPVTGDTLTIKQIEAQSKGGNIPDSVIRNKGLSSSGYSYRRPVGYNPVTKTMYVGPTGAIHGDFGRAISAPIQEGEYVQNNAKGYDSADGQKGWHVGFVHNRPYGKFATPGLGWYIDQFGEPKKFDKPANHPFLAQSLGENDLHKADAPPGAPAADTSAINLDDMDFDDL